MAQQQQMSTELRVEVRGQLQTQATAIKALDEQLWVIDEQLWQTDTRLGHRIDELSQTPFKTAIANASQVLGTASLGAETLAGMSDGRVLGSSPGSFPEELHGAVSEASPFDTSTATGGSPTNGAIAGSWMAGIERGERASEQPFEQRLVDSKFGHD